MNRCKFCIEEKDILDGEGLCASCSKALSELQGILSPDESFSGTHYFILETYADIENYKTTSKLTNERGEIILQGLNLLCEIIAFFKAFDYLGIEYELIHR